VSSHVGVTNLSSCLLCLGVCSKPLPPLCSDCYFSIDALHLSLGNRSPITLRIFIVDCLPALLCYFATAFLVLVPDTRLVRAALLPVTLWACIRACILIDVSRGDSKLNYLNEGLCVSERFALPFLLCLQPHFEQLVMTTISMRCLDWTFRREPLRRGNITDARQDSVEPHRFDFKKVLLDTADLGLNVRGHDWCWSRGLHVPEQTRPTDSSSAFVIATLISAAKNLLFFDAAHYAVQVLSPPGVGSPDGGTIFDPSLHPVPRYALASIITFLSGFTICAAIDLCYDIATLLGVVIFQQRPTQWPPISDTPWASTSLTELWSKRWHQVFRVGSTKSKTLDSHWSLRQACFMSLGFQPMYLVTGSRAFSVMGAFLVSAVLHILGTWSLGRGCNLLTVGGFFLVNGVGIILEGLFTEVSGKRVQGLAGNIWVLVFAVGFGQFLLDEWATKGLIGSQFIQDSLRPGKNLLYLTYHVVTRWHHSIFP
jgi:hypothetical protein